MCTPEVSEYIVDLNTSLKELFKGDKLFWSWDVVRKAISKKKKYKNRFFVGFFVVYFVIYLHDVSSYYSPYSLLKHNLGESIVILQYKIYFKLLLYCLCTTESVCISVFMKL